MIKSAQKSSELIPFEKIQEKFTLNFNEFVKNTSVLFKVNLSKETLWDTYLDSFPEKNGVKQSFNCNACKSFIKQFGGIVKIIDNKLVSIWNIQTGYPLYDKMFSNMNQLVINTKIKNRFLTYKKRCGIKSNFDSDNNQRHHFFIDIPNNLVYSKPIYKSDLSINSILAELEGTFKVFKRGLNELTFESLEITLELINQNSVERGREFKDLLSQFLKLKTEYSQIENENEKDNFCWLIAVKNSALAKVYSMSIGTLLKDLSSGLDIETSIIKFGRVMNPHNYKRPKNLDKVNKNQIKEAENFLEERGMINSLERRFACTEDISVNKLIWKNSKTRVLENKNQDIFTELISEKDVLNPKSFNKIQEISLEKFLKEVIPSSNKVEILLENRLIKNLSSLISPKNLDAPPLTKWNNGLTWVYYGGLAGSSIKKLVKQKGGKTEGLLRISLLWFNYDDYDLHLDEPSGEHIYHGNKKSKSGAELDVDMNVTPESRNPVENIIFPYNASIIENGKYKVVVNNYTFREKKDYGFIIEIEFKDEIYKFEYNKIIKEGENVTVCEFKIHPEKGLEFVSGLTPNNQNVNQNIWNMNTNSFQDVTLITNSPNYWDNSTGNKHVFFMLKGAINDDPLVRGFFNEQLPHSLIKHKRIFEILANRLNVSPATSENQLSGLGFELTKENNFVAKVTGSSVRTLRVKI